MNDNIKKAAELLKEADAIIIGGGSGLSSAAGYNHYHNNYIFQKYFRDFDDQLGVGEMTPSIIKLPFWEMTATYPNTFLINVNLETTTPPEHLKGKNLNICMDIAEFTKELKSYY